MRWIKKGLIFAASANAGWMKSHAQIPTVLAQKDRLRVYFATRPEPGLSLTTFLDVDADDPRRILYLHESPILDLGEPGSFDEHGIMPSCVLERDGEVWLYYGGWSRRASIPYSNWTGLAWSSDGGRSFRKAFRGPILDRTKDEIYSATGTFVYEHEGTWHAWYASGSEWIEVEGRWEELYTIKHAHSRDGIDWSRDNRRVFRPRRTPEATHRPTVMRLGGDYHMWFCHRGIEGFRGGPNAYRIGYASSSDLSKWKRDDSRSGLELSDTGWDSRMNAYPYIVRSGDRVYLFYNGNGFGASGFGYAILDEG